MKELNRKFSDIALPRIAFYRMNSFQQHLSFRKLLQVDKFFDGLIVKDSFLQIIKKLPADWSVITILPQQKCL